MITAEIKYNKWVKCIEQSNHNKTHGKVYGVLSDNGEVYGYIDDTENVNWDTYNRFQECNEDGTEIKKEIKVNIDYSKISFETQITKVAEELGEVIQAYKGKGDIGEEIADLIIASYGIARVLGIDIEKELEKDIHKVNNRILQLKQ